MSKLATWEELKKSEAARWQAALPEGLKGMGPEFAVAAATLVRQNPSLLKEELFPQRLVECAALGLRPNWGARGEAVITPGSGGVILVVGYKGYMRAFERDGLVRPGGFMFEAKMPEDEFDYFEDENGVHYRYRRNMSCARTFERMEFVFARAYLREGGVALAFRDKGKCVAVRDQVQGRVKDPSRRGASAWATWPLEMAIKGAAKEFARSHAFGENTERIMEYEHEQGEEKDMGEAARVENVRPITIQAPAALPEPAIRETIEPPTAREVEVVPVAGSGAPAKKMLIEDQSTTPDKPAETTKPAEPMAVWPEWAEIKLTEWESANEKWPQSIYEELVTEVRRLPAKLPERKKIGDRIKAVADREAAPAEPGSRG